MRRTRADLNRSATAIVAIVADAPLLMLVAELAGRWIRVAYMILHEHSLTRGKKLICFYLLAHYKVSSTLDSLPSAECRVC